MSELAEKYVCAPCGRGEHHACSEPGTCRCTVHPDTGEDTAWQPGDPCASCGSRVTTYDHDTGAHCGTCGRSDSDE